MVSDLRWDDLDLVRLLGEGQASRVWLAIIKRPARGLSAGEHVAVKRYRRWVLQEPGQHERVFRELVASTRVRHPHVVENICLVSDPDALPALVMRYYDAKSLDAILTAERLASSGLSLSVAFRWLAALIDAVVALHAADIYHRDIKPANILVASCNDMPILMDLGVVSNFLLAEQTQTTNFLGTIRYAEPSYLTGGDFTASSDWYSLGLVAYELFFGKRFLASEEQWARLVACKVSAALPSDSDLAMNYREISDLCGQDATEAVFYTLQTLLRGPTAVALRELRQAIGAEFWRRPFFELPDGKLMPGQPSSVPAFRFAPAYYGAPAYAAEGPEESLKEASRRLSRILFDRELPVPLASAVKRNYWEWRILGLDNIYELTAAPIEIYSIYAGGGGDDTTYDDLYINSGLLALYRYGYL